MATFLFKDIIFGPVKSRRLGHSLGINLLPNDCKVCNFNCIYCECGWTNNQHEKQDRFHTRENVFTVLTERLRQLKNNHEPVDAITFAGNGEPTMHPDFSGIIDDTIKARDQHYPSARIAVLSNATLIHKDQIFNALLKVDDNILKLDSVFDKTISLLNNPTGHYSLRDTIGKLKRFEGNFILQTMFTRGTYNGLAINNTTELEIKGWLSLLPELNPKSIMIYTIARDTPIPTLEKVPLDELNKIAEKARSIGYKVQVSG